DVAQAAVAAEQTVHGGTQVDAAVGTDVFLDVLAVPEADDDHVGELDVVRTVPAAQRQLLNHLFILFFVVHPPRGGAGMACDGGLEDARTVGQRPVDVLHDLLDFARNGDVGHDPPPNELVAARVAAPF